VKKETGQRLEEEGGILRRWLKEGRKELTLHRKRRRAIPINYSVLSGKGCRKL